MVEESNPNRGGRLFLSSQCVPQHKGGYNSPSEAQLVSLVQIWFYSDLNTILNTCCSPKRDSMI